MYGMLQAMAENNKTRPFTKHVSGSSAYASRSSWRSYEQSRWIQMVSSRASQIKRKGSVMRSRTFKTTPIVSKSSNTAHVVTMSGSRALIGCKCLRANMKLRKVTHDVYGRLYRPSEEEPRREHYIKGYAHDRDNECRRLVGTHGYRGPGSPASAALRSPRAVQYRASIQFFYWTRPHPYSSLV